MMQGAMTVDRPGPRWFSLPFPFHLCRWSSMNLLCYFITLLPVPLFFCDRCFLFWHLRCLHSLGSLTSFGPLSWFPRTSQKFVRSLPSLESSFFTVGLTSGYLTPTPSPRLKNSLASQARPKPGLADPCCEASMSAPP